MNYSTTIVLQCPHCNGKCQFIQSSKCHTYCSSEGKHHIYYICSNCKGGVITKWSAGTNSPNIFIHSPNGYGQALITYYPIVGEWQQRVDLSLINSEKVRADFKEAIDCYNHGFYNACMVMARRTIQQEMITKEIEGENLYKQIEATGISEKLKALLQKVKNFGNHGAHPDFCLYDEKGKQIEDQEILAKLSLEFLDRYFANEYEIDALAKDAPKSEKELKS